MNILNDMNQCYGCGACANVCTAGAIHFVMNSEGFMEPHVDENKCVSCGLCKRVCIAGETRFRKQNAEEPEAYAVSAEEELLKRSSSGGAFSVLAEYVLDMNGAVFGTAFNPEFKCVHMAITKTEELDRLRLSKYVQSDIGDSFLQVKKELEKDQWVLFSGTSCQVDGLYSFLGKDYEKLITVDLVCHGVPAPGIFYEYLENKVGIENIKKIEMRKREGWTSCFNLELKDGTKIEQESGKNVYQMAFHKNLILRRTCYSCNYQSLPRIADFTIGDLWGAKKLQLGMPYEKKSSVVLINNEKAKELFARALLDTEYDISKMNLSRKGIRVKNLNKNIYSCIVTSMKKRELFYKNYGTMSFEKAVLRTLYPKCVGLLTYMQDNYGSCATNIGLYKAVEQLGYTPVILNHLVAIHGVSANYAKGRLNLSGTFMEKNDYRSVNELCDSFILGSDQSMRWDFKRVMGNLRWLFMAFAEDSKRKIAYSGSFGPNRNNLDVHIRNLYKKLFSRFTDFSVREDYAVNMCKNLFDREAQQCVDPVFLVGKDTYLEIIKEANIRSDKPYLLAYLRYYSDEKMQLIREQAEQKNVGIVIICDANYYEELSRKYAADEIIPKPEFVDWLAYYVNASYIITDSFHGTCFSLIFEKAFISIKAGTTQRFDSLAKMLGADHINDVQIYDSEKTLLHNSSAFKSLDYGKVRQAIEAEREKGLCWLKNALEKPVALREMQEAISPEELIAYCNLLKEYCELKEMNSSALPKA